MVDPANGALILRPGEGRSIDLGNFAMVVKASEDLTRGAFSMLEAAEPPNFGPPMHIHHGIAEAFYVLEGEYDIFIEARSFTCPAGSFIFIPSGVEHGFRVGAVASRKLNLYAPAAMVGYFDELSAVLASDTADPQRLGEIAERHRMEVTGPIPEGYL